MPIRFHCKRCDQLLGIASRKAGSQIECPKCGLAQVVPTEDAAAAAAAMSQFVQEPVEGQQADFVVYDDQPSAIDLPRPPRQLEGPAPPPVAARPVARAPEPPPPDRIPSEKILFPRWVLYAQGVLLLVLAVAAFAAGYFVGRDQPPLAPPPVVSEPPPPQTVVLDGKLVYNPGTGRIAGDHNAVIMVLPVDRLPEKPFSVEGIRSADPPPQATHQSLQVIQQLGGAYVRADTEGEFILLLPDEGEYYVLLLSRNARRGEDVAPKESDLAEMGQYFRDPARLLDRFQYVWQRRGIGVDAKRIEENFQRTEKDR